MSSNACKLGWTILVDNAYLKVSVPIMFSVWQGMFLCYLLCTWNCDYSYLLQVHYIYTSTSLKVWYPKLRFVFWSKFADEIPRKCIKLQLRKLLVVVVQRCIAKYPTQIPPCFIIPLAVFQTNKGVHRI